MKKNSSSGNPISNMRIGLRLGIGFMLITVLILVVTTLGISSLSSVSYQIVILEKTFEAKYLMGLARIEQVRFEADGTPETATRVNDYLTQSTDLVSEVRTLMKSEENRKNAQLMLDATETFRENFNTYVSLESQKDEQGVIRAAAAGNVINAIRETLSLEDKYIKSLDTLEETQASFDKYLVLQTAFDRYMEVRISANKYVATESAEHAEHLRNLVAETENALMNAKSVLNAQDVLAELNIALDALSTYRDAFEKYDSLVQNQAQTRDDMRNSAVAASDAATTIENGVESFITNLEVSSSRLNIIISALAVIGSLIIAALLTRSITVPISKVIVNINTVANYDLSTRVPSGLLSRKDEVGTLAKAVEQIGENLRSILNNISDTSQALSASSEELAATSQNASSLASDVAMTINEMSDGATEQAKSTEHGAWNVGELGKLIEKDQDYVNELIKSADDVQLLKDEGIDIIDFLVSETDKSSKASATVYDIIRETNTSAEKIENASQMIQNIADQTNLLALNAAIEAARAGESGRGFAVVAEEIRKLAEQSTSFTGEIASAIQELITKASEAVRTMEETQEIVKSQTQSVKQTNEKFNGIADAMTTMENIIDTIKNSSQIMEEKKSEIVGIIESLSAISEENAAGTQEATTSIAEQENSIKEIANASMDLAKLAEEMQETISQFKL